MCARVSVCAWCIFPLIHCIYLSLSTSLSVYDFIFFICFHILHFTLYSLHIHKHYLNIHFSTATDTTYEVAAAFKLSSVVVPSHHSLNRLDGSGADSSSVTGNETVVKNNVDNINGHHSRIISQADDNHNKQRTEHSDDPDQQQQHIIESNPIEIQRSSYDDTNDDNDTNHSAKVSATIRNVLLLSEINDRSDNNTIEAEPITLTNLEMVQQTVRGHANNATANAVNNRNLQSVIIQNDHSRLMHHPSTSPLRYTTIETADTGAIMALEAAPSSPLQYSTLHTIVQNNNNNYLSNNNAQNYGNWNYELSLDLRQKHSDDDKDRQHSHQHMEQHYHHQQPQQQQQHNHHHHNQHGVVHTGDNSGGAMGNASVVVIAGHDHHTHADLMDEAQTLISTVAANNHHFDDDHIHHHATKIAVNDPHQTSISGETAVMRTGLMYTYGSAIATAPSNLSQHQTSSNGSANGANSTIDEVIADTLKDEMVEGTTPTPTTTSEETNYLQLMSHNHHHHTIRSQSSGGDSRSPSGLSQEEYESGLQTFANLSNAAHTTSQRDTIYSNSSVGDPSEHTGIIHPISISYESPLHSTGGAGISTR